MKNIMVTVNQEYLDDVARPEYFHKYVSNIGVLEGINRDLYKVRMTLVNTWTNDWYTRVINVWKGQASMDAEEFVVDLPIDDDTDEEEIESMIKNAQDEARKNGIDVRLLNFNL